MGKITMKRTNFVDGSIKAGAVGLVADAPNTITKKDLIDHDVSREEATTKPDLVKDAMAKMTAQIPLGRLGKPEELGAAICFLCSEQAGFITGHILPHAGGWA